MVIGHTPKRKHQQNMICNWNDDLQQSRQRRFLCCSFEMNSWLVGWVFFYSQKWKNLMTLTTVFCRLVCFVAVPFSFSSTLVASVSIVLDFYVFILHEKARWQLMDYWFFISHFEWNMQVWVCMCMHVYGCFGMIEIDWHEKNNFFEWRKKVNTFIISFQIVYYLVSWEYLILLYCYL